MVEDRTSIYVGTHLARKIASVEGWKLIVEWSVGQTYCNVRFEGPSNQPPILPGVNMIKTMMSTTDTYGSLQERFMPTHGYSTVKEACDALCDIYFSKPESKTREEIDLRLAVKNEESSI